MMTRSPPSMHSLLMMFLCCFYEVSLTRRSFLVHLYFSDLTPRKLRQTATHTIAEMWFQRSQ